MRWRPTLVWLHRDLGYLAIGLTIAYGVSGVAVNHKHDWNYNQSTEREQVSVGKAESLLTGLPEERRAALAASLDSLTKDEEKLLVARITEALGRRDGPRNAFWRGPDKLSLYFELGGLDTVDWAPSTGLAERTMLRDRPVLRQLNFLHLNEGRGFWTWLADAFAVVLVFLAVSGALMVGGRKGLAGRGGVLAAIGVAIPLLALWLLR